MIRKINERLLSHDRVLPAFVWFEGKIAPLQFESRIAHGEQAIAR